MQAFIALFNKQNTKHILALALPMMLSNITVPLLGLVDTAVIGHLSNSYYLGGVAVGSAIITLILWLLGFLKMATTGLVAQAFGSDNQDKQLQILIQSSVLAVVLGLLVVLLQQPIIYLSHYFSHASENVNFYAEVYFDIRIWSTPFALLNIALLGWLLGRQQPKAAMWLLIIANSVNIVLDLFFVVALNLGVTGAALASVFSDIIACAAACYLVNKQLGFFKKTSLQHILSQLRISQLKQLLFLNLDIFIRSLCLQATFIFMTFKGASFGDNVVSANAILLNLLLLVSYALDGIAYYAEAEVGRNIGKKNLPALNLSVKIAFAWSAVIAIGFSCCFLVGGKIFIKLLTNITAVQENAFIYLPWLIVLPLLAFGSYLFDGVYIGAAKGKVMRNSMLFSTLFVFFPFWFATQSYGNHALWFSMCAFSLSRCLTLGKHYLKNRHNFIY